MADVAEALKQAQGAWNETAAMEGSGGSNFDEPIPEGNYQFELIVPKSGQTVAEDGDGGIRARIMLKAVNAPEEQFEGRFESKSWTLINPDNSPNEMGMSILKTDLENMGFDSAEFDLSSVGGVLYDLEGAVVNAAVKHKPHKNDDGVWVNVFINSLERGPEEA